LPGWRNELLKVRAEEIKMDLYCVPCKQAFLNENSYFYHKKGKKHISTINKMKGQIPTIDVIDKSMFKDEAEEE